MLMRYVVVCATLCVLELAGGVTADPELWRM